MLVWHRVGYSHLDRVEDALDAIGVEYKKTDGLHGAYVINFEITESDPRWPQISELLHSKQTFDFVWTEFSVEEVLAAEWLKVAAIRQIGYAEPREALGWQKVTFENGCPECGVGARQKAPFRIRGEPRRGKVAFAGLYSDWPLFCIPEVVTAMEAQGIAGFEAWPVLSHKTGQPLPGLRQIMVPTVAQPALVESLAETERFQKETCGVCGQIRYSYYTRGMMPMSREALASGEDFQLTHEWFGSGRAARREILVSNRVARFVANLPGSGLVLWPIQLI